MEEQARWELGRDDAHFSKIDMDDRDAEWIEQRVSDLIAPGAYFDPYDPKVIEDALGEAHDFEPLEWALRTGDRDGVFEYISKRCKEYALKEAKAKAIADLKSRREDTP